MKKIAALAGLLLCAQLPVAHAQSAAPSWQQNGGWSLHFGADEGHKRVTINRETAPLWQHNFSSTRIELVGELGVSYWWTNNTPTAGFHDSMWQLSAIPLFRYWMTDRFFLEGGIGATGFSEHKFNNKRLSTTFQFGDHIGVGYQVTPSTRIGLRASHFSNAGIKEPNPGLNAFQVTLGTTF